MRTLTDDEVEIGAILPELTIELSPTLIVSTALATRDFTRSTTTAKAPGRRGRRTSSSTS